MNKWLNIEKERRISIIEDLSRKVGLSPLAIEKDWWVTMVLKVLFSTPFANHLSFKGGTSLSKCWNLIERFSEDVDIAIDREFLGFSGELSKTQISDKLRRASCSFVREIMKIEVEKQLSKLGIDKSLFDVKVNITPITTTDPEIIEVHYHSMFSEVSYIQSRVLIEVSGRSMNEPIEEVEINTMISQAYPNTSFTEIPFSIRVVSPKRTFLEKACLLHEEFSKSSMEVRSDRMSRHIYDLEKLMDTEIAKEAMNDIELYKSVIEHRKKFIGLKGFDYSTLLPQTILFVPPAEIMPSWEGDYATMQQSMIYGESLPFNKLIERITKLNERFRKIDID
ncbi:putative nucleotidyltransferase component of viral defense system [Dysgonomonas sp. PH5-45]|uniref:nucleotidyl transferase AbiEii/AbiGii toxin family protein n=1 Tax=unclassified Dysgonomonas TaxID=2630389 RepID=UPI002476F6BB|nr:MULTISPECIES: nucleotidyl transferase AbiEii/AbiGii toxin family protein [unclassified Dysgonomonas]MDH6355924.1 putative nucleotidyltransferase component of viral defense system [Dysgonomonas sp. PH5-45]MDH6388819.1 putative nucleotidyltransferase component of viral defense system [Dysgonomonas sp. PH5-37]